MFTLTTFSPAFNAWLAGAATGMGLFVVVGAQSAFVLKQGVMRLHILSVLGVCALIDAIVIFASVWGVQQLTAWAPGLTHIVTWGGAAFLLWYAAQSAVRAWRGQAGAAGDMPQAVPSRRSAVLGAMAFTLLNPHFWLDMLLVGSLAHSFDAFRLAFGLGALTASLIWLGLLGLGARLMAPLFARPAAWRVLDGVIAVVMVLIAARLAVAGLA